MLPAATAPLITGDNSHEQHAKANREHACVCVPVRALLKSTYISSLFS